MSHKKIRLCHINEIGDGESKGFSTKDDEDQDIFIVNQSGKFYAYINRCPHTGVSLNWQPDVFLDYDNLYIQCSIHAARFEIRNGFCVWGPCLNQSLRKFDIEIIDDAIYCK